MKKLLYWLPLIPIIGFIQLIICALFDPETELCCVWGWGGWLWITAFIQAISITVASNLLAYYLIVKP